MFSARNRTASAGRRVVRVLPRASAASAIYYFYVLDPEFGPGFIKICTYFPYPAKVWVNGHEWAKRQADRAGIALHGAGQRVRRLCAARRGCRRSATASAPPTCRRSSIAGSTSIPTPLTAADRAAGYWWELSMRQVEVSRTLVFDDPRRARGFFEALVADNIGIGRPEAGLAVFARPRAPHRPRPPPDPGLHPRHRRAASTSATSTAASSNTSRKAERCASRPSSTSHPTSASCARLEHLPELVAKARRRQPASAYHRTRRSGLCHRLCAL